MSSLKETIRRNFMTTLNATIDSVKENTTAPVGLELADFLSDYGKEMASLLYCYEFMTEDEHDAIVSKVNLILKTVKERQKSVSQR